MKIILLRHEERDSDPSFDVHLNQNGINNRNNIISRLKEQNINIDSIISSPFIRCLDTISPFCNSNNKLINVDYALSEYFDKSYTGVRSPRLFTDNELQKYPINAKYSSSLTLDNFRENCTFDELQDRLKKLIICINDKYKNQNNNILIVSHMSIINALLNINNISRSSEDEFPMGGMTYIDNLHIF
jgi:broad specificity phosphatase PhoE